MDLYDIISRKDKFFKLKLPQGGTTVSIDRLKPAYLKEKVSNDSVDSDVVSNDVISNDVVHPPSTHLSYAASYTTVLMYSHRRPPGCVQGGRPNTPWCCPPKLTRVLAPPHRCCSARLSRVKYQQSVGAINKGLFHCRPLSLLLKWPQNNLSPPNA